jgi:predicted permease
MNIAQDVRFAIRMLLKSPGFTAVAILTLVLGIGANAAIFSVVNAVVLQPFAYGDPGNLVLIYESIPKLGGTILTVPAPDAVDYQKQNQTLAGVAIFQNQSFELSGRGRPEQVTCARASSSLLSTLGVEPLIGRGFTPEEDQPGHHVAIISYSMWQRVFGAESSAIGQPLTLSREDYTVVGVMPKSFAFPTPGLSHSEPADLWVPIALSKDELADRGDDFDYSVIARLKPGISIDQATADVNNIAAGIRELLPASVRDEINLTAGVKPLTDIALGKVKTLAMLLLGAVALVLLISCANVANLLLTRAAGRQREVAVRIALGAGRLRLIRQLLTESLLLSLIGGAGGLALATWGTRILASLAPDSIPRRGDIKVDIAVLAFTFALSLLTGLFFGLAPALSASRTNLNEALKQGSRSATEGIGPRRLRKIIVTSEVALATILMIGAGLLIRSFARVRDTSPGFQPQSVLTMSVALPWAAYSTPEKVHAFYNQLNDRMQAVPGIDSFGFSTDLPLKAAWTRIFTPEGDNPPPGAALNTCMNSLVLGDYFKTMRIPLLEGRLFNDHDRLESMPVVIVSESIANRFWPNHGAIGKRLKWGPVQSTSDWLTVVGVVGDVKPGALDEETRPHTYEPYLQSRGWFGPSNIAIRSLSAGNALASVREIVAGLDNQLAITDIRTMSDRIDTSIAPRRFSTFLLILFASTALLLSTVGIYGVIAYSVAQRRNEIGIRMALGADRGTIQRLVFREAALVTVIGVAIGLAGAAGSTRFLSGLLYEIRPLDPATLIGVSLLLAMVAAVASLIPARGATRIDPASALRSE